MQIPEAEGNVTTAATTQTKLRLRTWVLSSVCVVAAVVTFPSHIQDGAHTSVLGL